VSENALKTTWEKVVLTWDNLVDKQTQLNQIIMVLINTYIIIIYIKYIAPKLSQKLRPDGSALAFCYSGPAKSRCRLSLWPGLARPILARLGPAPGLRPGQAQHYRYQSVAVAGSVLLCAFLHELKNLPSELRRVRHLFMSDYSQSQPSPRSRAVHHRMDSTLHELLQHVMYLQSYTRVRIAARS
jgi:hypothetical protein